MKSNSIEKYIKIEYNDSNNDNKESVFVLKSSLSSDQINQIMSVKLIIPKLKIKWKDKNYFISNNNNNNNNINNNINNETIDTNKRSIGLRRLTINSFKTNNSINDYFNNNNNILFYNNKRDNNSLKETNNNNNNNCGQEKRRLKTKINDNQLFKSNKKTKTIENNDCINSNEETFKENKNYCNSELSRTIGLINLGNTCYCNSIIQGLLLF
jgi:hypothetical protein